MSLAARFSPIISAPARRHDLRRRSKPPIELRVRDRAEQKAGEPVVSLKEAAEMFGCTYHTIRNYVRVGLLSAVFERRPGVRVFVRRSELDLFCSRWKKNKFWMLKDWK